MRRIQIKIWPELTGYMPAIIPFDRIDETKANPIDIDFSNVQEVDSSSLTIILIKLIKNSSSIGRQNWELKLSSRVDVNKRLVELGFIELLNLRIPNNNLFLQPDYFKNKMGVSVQILPFEFSGKIMFPIKVIEFKKFLQRRDAVEDFKDFLVDNLKDLYPRYGIKVNKLIQILHEIAKNSADHTDQDAFFGLDITVAGDSLSLKFAFGDLGIGINQSVRLVLKEDEVFKKKDKHLGVTDAYNYALSMGFTSKPYSLVNRGIGMSTIFDLSKQINLNLSVFDAKSRGLLSSAKNNSHVELRKIFYNIGFSVGFYYFGELTQKIK